MTFKKWRPFWSYDVEKTEQWLGEMSSTGKRLVNVNRLTRLFSFEEGIREQAEYQISFDKSQSEMPQMLEMSGWETAVAEGNWKFLKNMKENIQIYPTRDDLLGRNRLHSLVLTCVSIYYGVQLIIPLMLLFFVLSGSGEVIIESSPFWLLTYLYFLQVIGVIVLTIVMTRRLRAFERKYYHTAIDEKASVGKTFVKWRPNWMTAPDKLEEWLEQMATEGNHLVKVRGTRFIFEKGVPRQMSYICDFQWKASPHYIEIHKSAGWQLKYVTSHSFLKYSLWATAYEEGEPKPRLTYDADEKKVQTRRITRAQWGANLFGVAMLAFALWIISNSAGEVSWSGYQKFLFGALVASGGFLVFQVIRTIRYALRMRDHSSD